jgi:hypothetical protein
MSSLPQLDQIVANEFSVDFSSSTFRTEDEKHFKELQEMKARFEKMLSEQPSTNTHPSSNIENSENFRV